MDAREGQVLLGAIRRPWGRRGELLLQLETDWPYLRFRPGRTVRILLAGGREVKHEVEGFRMIGDRPLLKLEGVDGIGEAERLRGGTIVALPDELEPVPGGEPRLADLPGLEVLSRSGQRLGTVRGVLEAPAAHLAELALEDGSQVLVPLVPPILTAIDLARGCLVIDPPPGLLDPGEALVAGEGP
ncbi:MAG: 16S rRNA processing protein RimM [Acidobacteria bacterium]|nr:MAG: 16S rRNA processing protein RimM [Acidobacteriota bacterium]